MEKNKTYNMLLKCSNCSLFNRANIPFGMTTFKYLQGDKNSVPKCANCGCKTLRDY